MTPRGRWPNCLHPEDEHSRVYVSEGGGTGRTVIRCRAWVRGHKCRCERPVRSASPRPVRTTDGNNAA